MSDILTGTPADLTYAHDLVRQAWMVVWAVTSGALVVILGWMGLSFIMAEHLGTRQTGWREMVPRLVLGLVAAASSLWWCALVLDVADAVSGFIAVSLDVTAGDLLRSTLRTLLTAVNAGSVGMALLLAVLPEPVAILQPIRIRGGRRASSDLSTSLSRPSSVNCGLKLVRLPPMRISARYMIVSTASI